MHKEIENKIKEKSTRLMTSGDRCHQRIFHVIPMMCQEVNIHMVEDGIYNYEQALFDILNEWQVEQKRFIDESVIYAAITEIRNFSGMLANLVFRYHTNNGEIPFSQWIVDSTKLTNYQKVLEACRISVVNQKNQIISYSKIIKRSFNFKKKLQKVLTGKLKLERFITDEIIPQKRFLDIFTARMEEFTIENFLIFILLYDIKHIKD